MDVPSPDELVARIASLPAGAPLLARLPDAPAVHLVGGAARDLLMGGAPVDLDLVVEADLAAIVRQLGGTVRVHDRFGTSTVQLDGWRYDLARARRETYAHPGALPDVEPGTLAQDLRRRDFTVNAIAIALAGERAGVVTAPPRAVTDLGDHRLRVFHDRSFIDDPTRLLRLARYWSRLGFPAEPHTLALAHQAVAGKALATVTGPRVGTELRLLARELDPIDALARLAALGVDRAIAPGFGLKDAELGRRALSLLEPEDRRDRLTLAVAGRAMAASELASLLDRLAFAAGDRDAVVAAATRADGVAAALADARRPSEIAAAVAGGGPELVALAGALGPEAAARAWLTTLRHVRLEIDGRALIAAGVPEGPQVGRGLHAALADKLDGRVSGAAQELARALAGARSPG